MISFFARLLLSSCLHIFPAFFRSSYLFLVSKRCLRTLNAPIRKSKPVNRVTCSPLQLNLSVCHRPTLSPPLSVRSPARPSAFTDLPPHQITTPSSRLYGKMSTKHTDDGMSEFTSFLVNFLASFLLSSLTFFFFFFFSSSLLLFIILF